MPIIIKRPNDKKIQLFISIISLISPSLSALGFKLIIPLYLCCSRIYFESLTSSTILIIWTTYLAVTIVAPNVFPVFTSLSSSWRQVVRIEDITAINIKTSMIFHLLRWNFALSLIILIILKITILLHIDENQTSEQDLNPWCNLNHF